MKSIFIVLLVSTFLAAFFAVTLVTSTTTSLLYSVGVNIDPTNTNGGNATVSQLLALGGGWVRVEFKDNGQGTNFNPFTWVLYDAALRSYKSAGLKILLIIDYQTAQQVPWKQADAAWAAYAEVYASKLAAIASRYNGVVDKYEIWNEPDLSQTNVPPQAYANLLFQAFQAVRVKANSQAGVVMGGLASGNPSYVAQVRSSSPGQKLACTSIALHPYGQRPSNNWPSSSWGFGTVAGLLQNYKNVESAIPYLISEVGTQDMTVQGEFPQHFFAAVEGLVEETIWFCWSDGMVSPFGLLATNGQQKPSYGNYKQYIDSKLLKQN